MPTDPREVLEEKVADTLYGVATDPAYYNLTALNAARFAAARILALPEIAAALSAQPSGEGERDALKWIYERAGKELWASRRRGDESGHHCLYRSALHAVKDRAKATLRGSAAPTSPPASAAPADGGEALREQIGAAFVLALQGDYSEVDRLAREIPLEWRGGKPSIAALSRSPARDARPDSGMWCTICSRTSDTCICPTTTVEISTWPV